jgi:hypothetical protein
MSKARELQKSQCRGKFIQKMDQRWTTKQQQKFATLQQNLPDNGDGWAHSITLCFNLFTTPPFFFAKFPHKRNTTGCFASDEIVRITASVKSCQPIYAYRKTATLTTVPNRPAPVTNRDR